MLSLALIHEHFYSSRQLAQLDFAKYTGTLAAELFHYYQHPGVTHVMHTSQVMLDMDRVIPCGLILNELITNALKYAYPQLYRQNHAGIPTHL